MDGLYSVFFKYWYWYCFSIFQIEYWYFSISKSYWILNTSIFILYWSMLWKNHVVIHNFIREYLILLLPYLWCSSWDKSVRDIERPLEDWPPSTAEADFPPVLFFNLRCRFGEPSWDVSDLDFFVEAWKEEEFRMSSFLL